MTIQTSPPSLKPPSPALFTSGEIIEPFSDAVFRRSLPGQVTRGKLETWIRGGLQSHTDHMPVYLEWVKLGGGKGTTLEAVIRFHEAVNK